MAQDYDAVVGNWYNNVADDQVFTVLEIDEESDLIEIQFDSGDLDQIALSDWADLSLEIAAEPENWDAAMDDLEELDIDEEDWLLEPSG